MLEKGETDMQLSTFIMISEAVGLKFVLTYWIRWCKYSSNYWSYESLRKKLKKSWKRFGGKGKKRTFATRFGKGLFRASPRQEKVLKKLEKKFAGYEKVRTFAVRAVQKTGIAENEKDHWQDWEEQVQASTETRICNRLRIREALISWKKEIERSGESS